MLLAIGSANTRHDDLFSQTLFLDSQRLFEGDFIEWIDAHFDAIRDDTAAVRLHSETHVVINPGVSWSLDEQFGVDIDDNLLVRGYIVGKHALQVKDALLIAHYDGPDTPGNTGGETTGHMGQPAIIYGTPLHRPGLYGKALELSEATTNLLANSGFEAAALTSWTDYATGTASGTRTATSGDAWEGVYAAVLTKTAGANADRWGIYQSVTVTSGSPYAVQVRVRLRNVVGASGSSQANLLSPSVGGSGQGTTAPNITNEWTTDQRKRTPYTTT